MLALKRLRKPIQLAAFVRLFQTRIFSMIPNAQLDSKGAYSDSLLQLSYSSRPSCICSSLDPADPKRIALHLQLGKSLPGRAPWKSVGGDVRLSLDTLDLAWCPRSCREQRSWATRSGSQACSGKNNWNPGSPFRVSGLRENVGAKLMG